MVIPQEKQAQCPYCHAKTTSRCEKRNIGLHMKCFSFITQINTITLWNNFLCIMLIYNVKCIMLQKRSAIIHYYIKLPNKYISVIKTFFQ